MKYKKVLITGGAGFVGSNLAIRYKKDYPTAKIICLDNLKRRGSELNINRLKENGVIFIHGDIRNYEDIESVGKIDLLIECSAECSVLAGYNSSLRYLIDTNLLGLVNCLEFASGHEADVIFLSTSRVYPMEKINSLNYTERDARFEIDGGQKFQGISKKGISEEFPLDGYRSFYGATKLASELILKEYIAAKKIRGVINRCGVLAGPWQMGKVEQGFFSLWIARHFYGQRLSYIGFGGNGKQVRDVLHIDDLYDAVQLELGDMDSHNGQIYNIGGGYKNSISLMELTKLSREITGKSIKINRDPRTRKADIVSYITDYSKFNRASGWSPKNNLKRTAGDILNWVIENKRSLEKIF